MNFKKFGRFIVIILDSVGIGELPDADLYGDQGSNTLGNIANKIGGMNLPNLEKLGLGNIYPLKGVKKNLETAAAFGKMAEISVGKDTVTGHWELMGLTIKKPFAVFHEGFPKEIMDEFTDKTGYKYLGNYAASGTEIIKQLGEEHLKTGYPVVYTSADSVFQIAAHEENFGLKELFRICEISRKLLDKHQVGRVIARPFIGKDKDSFIRTANRKDYSFKPFDKTILDLLVENGRGTLGIGKIYYIFAGSGITETISTKNNMEGILRTIEKIKTDQNNSFIFTNLVDFDMLYGHRNDVEGYYNSLKEFDDHLPEIMTAMREDDCLVITADHGCDPTTESTDHSREYVPLLVYNKGLKNSQNLGIRSTFSDLAKTIEDNFQINGLKTGTSFLKEI